VTGVQTCALPIYLWQTTGGNESVTTLPSQHTTAVVQCLGQSSIYPPSTHSICCAATGSSLRRYTLHTTALPIVRSKHASAINPVHPVSQTRASVLSQSNTCVVSGKLHPPPIL